MKAERIFLWGVFLIVWCTFWYCFGEEVLTPAPSPHVVEGQP